MRSLLIIFLCVFSIKPVLAEHLDLDQLLRDVKKSQGQEGKINKQREARFLAEKRKQEQLLAAAKAELKKQEQRSEQLKAQLDANEAELSQLETELKQRSGVLGELFGVARQAAGDLQVDLETSLVSAEFPERAKVLDKIATSKSLPTIEDLEVLWYTLQQEMTESGKVVHYGTEILTASGDPRNAEVIRIGVFNAIADGKYLRYLPGPGKLVELARQPDGKYLNLAEKFSAAKPGEADMAIDPTRGVILSMLIQTPNTFERIKQGGVIGYIIIALGISGFLYAIFRYLTLSLISRKMHKQIHEFEDADEKNPLGRVIAAVEQNKAHDIESMELVLDEAITQEIPVLEKGLAMIKLLAAVAPLLGLLGTVTGMIATFQSISLFGTGDPKLMASGISQALVTTMLGLMVAVPLLFLHSLVSARSKTLVQILDEQSAGLIARRMGK